MVDVKICGIKTPETMTAALEGGARFVGLVFVPESPRYVEIEVAAYLAHFVPKDVYRVGLFQDPDDDTLRQTLQGVPLDMIQLHGRESPGRVAEIRHFTGLPVIKAVSIVSEADFAFVEGYQAAADWLLFDAATGGSGQAFDWRLLQQYCSKNPLSKPWMLAGGLNERNINEALSHLDPDAIDVSSGVESSRGSKDPDMIRAFLGLAGSL